MAGTIMLTDRWEISTGSMLPEFAAPGTSAHPAAERGGTDRSVFALAVDGDLPVRGALLRSLRSNPISTVLSPIEFGAIEWPGAPGRRFIIVLPRPLGGRLAAGDEATIERWSEDAVRTRLLRPILPGLKAIALDGVAHRGVRSSNLYCRDAGGGELVLGECVAQPPGFAQPAVFETIEGAMAQPTGRGPGTSADDLYALGVVILHLLGGVPPSQGRSAEALIEEKLRRGSFATLATEARLSLAMGDLVRGLLADDPALRWGFEEIGRWLDGDRVPLRFATPAAMASRPFEIGGESVGTPRTLAPALGRHRDEAVQSLRTGGVDAWLRRSLRDPILADRVAKAVADSESRTVHRDERLIARAGLALFPEAPLHYRGNSLAYDGLGSALAAALLQGRDPGVFADILQSNLLTFWAGLRGGLPPALAIWSPQYEQARHSLQDIAMGAGIERVAYDLDPFMPCLSPFVAERRVRSVPGLLTALDAAASRGRIEGLPIDRHVAAFAVSRSGKIDAASLPGLTAADPGTRALAVTALFATLQTAHGPPTLPALARQLHQGLAPVVASVRHQRSRERLISQLEAAVRDGDIARLLKIAADPEYRRVDGERFREARLRFARARRDLSACVQERRDVGERSAVLAGSLGAGVAAVLGGGILLGYLLVSGIVP
jgi:hypothetical protein